MHMEIAGWLGVTQLTVFFLSFVSERLLVSAAVGESTAYLANIEQNLRRIRLSNLLALLNSVAIVVLGVLFYSVFSSRYPVLALVALGCFLAEGIILAASKIGPLALIPLSQKYIEAGAVRDIWPEALVELLFQGIDRKGYLIHNLFFGVGALIWYGLFLHRGYLPAFLATWGLLGVALLLVSVVLAIYGQDSPAWLVLVLVLPYLPFELVLGSWLVFVGFT